MNLRSSSRPFALGSLILLLACALLAGTGVGAMAISPAQVAAILAKWAGILLPVEFNMGQEAVLLSIRLPRVLLGALVGGSLAIAGGAMQGLFRLIQIGP